MDRIFFKNNASFSPHLIHSRLPNSPDWEVESAPFPKDLFTQEFSYLTKGAQSFVFASQDGQYILKFYRFPKTARPFSGQSKRSSKDLSLSFASFKIAFETLKKESQVVLVHLNRTRNLYGTITLIDKLGTRHRVNLDDVTFLVQQRGVPYFTLFDKVMADPEKARKTIDKTLTLFTSCWEKGVVDCDAILEKNYGFIGDTPFIIDLGRWGKCASPLPLDTYLKKMTISLQEKLSRENPQLFAYLNEQMNLPKDNL